MVQKNAAITGVCGYVPDYILTNAELEKMVDTSDKWITDRTGIKERRILKGEGKGASVMAVQAAQGLLNKINCDPSEIELIICATITPDFPVPAMANTIAKQINANAAFAFDISAACSGFIFALVTASQFIKSGQHKKIMVVTADKMSSIVDYTDRATCVLFGDGAAAVMIEATEEKVGLIDFHLKSDGAGAELLHVRGGGSRYPFSETMITTKEQYVRLEGSTVFKFAVTNMAGATNIIMDRNNLSINDIAWLVPHQANERIIYATADRMNINRDKVMMNIQRYGNTTNATIPLCLWDYESQLKKGDNLILTAFGSGFTWGSCYLKWAYDPK